MKLKNMWKRFWTLDVHNHEGFTLVELIIVIAILAILSTGAIAGYSVYVKQAAQTADKALAQSVANALELGYYTNGFNTGSAAVVLTTEGASCGQDDIVINNAADAADYVQSNPGTALAFVINAMNDAFGANWFDSLKVKHDGWNIGNVAGIVESYNDSVFAGNEPELLDDVQTLTNSFANILSNTSEIENLIGQNYTDYLDTLGNKVDMNNPQNLANTAATYVAYRCRNITSAQKTSFVTAWQNQIVNAALFSTALSTPDDPAGLAAGMAAMYAKGEAVARYLDADPNVTCNATGVDEEGNTIHYSSYTEWFTSQPVGGANSNAINGSLQAILNQFQGYFTADAAGAGAAYMRYLSTQAAADAEAYLAVMGAINDSADALLNDLNNENLYGGSGTKNMLQSYLSLGEMAVLNGNTNCIAIMVHQDELGCVVTMMPFSLQN